MLLQNGSNAFAKIVSRNTSISIMNISLKHFLFAFLFLAIGTGILASCARMGSPDGGWYDETPPYVVSSSPADRGVNAKSKKIVISFNEYIKLDRATEKVVISPPQLEQPEIKVAGRNIVVQLKDSLKENTTYTIDFSDAISDNNEGNPLGNYTYSFSTGSVIDTLEVSGYVLDAETLEPVKGTRVGLYRADDYAAKGDTSWVDPFMSKSLLRTSQTDGNGHFIIRGIAPGSYRVFALQDTDENFYYSQAAEGVAFCDDIIVPTSKPDIRQDTLWTDTLHIKDIIQVGYTHFLPDDIVLRQFTKAQKDRFFLKSERTNADRFTLFYSGPSEHTPAITGLNFDSTDAFIIEPKPKNDTITYWLRDTALVNTDTLNIVIAHEVTDTLGNLVMQSDTLEVLAKVPYAKRQRELKKEMDDWYKQLEKRRKKSEEEITDTIFPATPFKPNYRMESAISPVGKISIEFPEPLLRMDTAAVHLYVKQEEDWYRAPFSLRKASFEGATDRHFEIFAEWIPEAEYSFEVDSAAFESIYGLVSDAHKAGLKVNGPNVYSSLFVNISGVEHLLKSQKNVLSEQVQKIVADSLHTEKTDSLDLSASLPTEKASGGEPSVIVQLLNSSDKVVEEAKVENGTAEFYYLKQGEYYLRAFIDRNGNGKWDTGNYDEYLQPEEVYYYPEKVECRAKWDVTRSWNLTARKLNLQKPGKLIKQKGETKRKQRLRNADRAREKGIPLPQSLR